MLVLDYDKHVDWQKDIAAQQQYSAQVWQFLVWVERYRDACHAQ